MKKLLIQSSYHFIKQGIKLSALISGFCLTSCSDQPETINSEITAAENDCQVDPGIDYLCGLVNAEDILQIGSSQWLLASGMNGFVSGDDVNGRLHLINLNDKSFEVIFPSENSVIATNTEFRACPGPINPDNISVHGLSLLPLDETNGIYRLYTTGHGDREAIEIFEIDLEKLPGISWVGCVPMPQQNWMNSVTVMNDGSFYASKFMNIDGGIEQILAGEITGEVYYYHPESGISILEGTGHPGPNGIEHSADEQYLFVASFGEQSIYRYDLHSSPLESVAVSLPVSPDNIRWSQGLLYTAGEFAQTDCPESDCRHGWGVFAVDPDNMTATEIFAGSEELVLQGVSTASPVRDEIWIGTYSGDRVGILKRL